MLTIVAPIDSARGRRSDVRMSFASAPLADPHPNALLQDWDETVYVSQSKIVSTRGPIAWVAECPRMVKKIVRGNAARQRAARIRDARVLLQATQTSKQAVAAIQAM